MKSLVTKLFAVIFVVMLAAGCASSITAPQQPNLHKKEIKKAPKPGDVKTSGDMIADLDKPSQF